MRPAWFFGIFLAVVGALLGAAGWDPFGRQKAPALAPAEPTQRERASIAFAERVRAEVSRRANEIRICFTDPVELGIDAEIRPEFAGRIPISFRVGGMADAHDAVVNSRRGTVTDTCVEQRLRVMRLPFDGPDVEVNLEVEVILDAGASITAAIPVVSGRLQPPVVKDEIEAHHGEIARCYVERALLDGATQGNVDVSFDISTTGEVAWVKVAESTVDDMMLDFCVVQTVRQWVFPAAAGGHATHARYSFNFTPTAW